MSKIIFELFLVFLKVGFLGFGGGYAMLPLIREEAFMNSIFSLSSKQFSDLMVLDVLIPGPIAINSATYVGYLAAGIMGALVATFTVSIPSFVLVPVLIKYEEKVEKNKYLKQILNSMKAASVGLIMGIGVMILLENAFGIDNLKQIFKSNIDWFLVIIAVVGFFLHEKLKISPILLTIAAGFLGYLAYYIF